MPREGRGDDGGHIFCLSYEEAGWEVADPGIVDKGGSLGKQSGEDLLDKTTGVTQQREKSCGRNNFPEATGLRSQRIRDLHGIICRHFFRTPKRNTPLGNSVK